MDGRLYVPWFAVGDPEEDELETLEAAQHTFVSVLRERAAAWPCDPEDTAVLRPEETGFAHLLALLSPVTPGTDSVGSVFGAFFDGQGVLGTEVHNQMLIPMLHESVVEVLHAAGSPAQCAELTADWFERVQRHSD
ncbi:hypothetical protein amrb99_86000 [Actinomadura sp. RB99]|jgi:hypothetical protein|uniref:hypothetical protein n=1 Tax=Actinomadura sp. RB99 TaxID=2691577 RepID=UPI0016875879|nr:hypothetical protein [Actinomadura sp. RB99]MBD2899616.1 hypothetical protein [Actinomadura sp. RB99]